VAAGVAAAGTVTLVTLTLRRALSPRLALLTGLVLAFGTATWSVSADTLWPHGPDQLFLAAGMYCLARNKYAAASVAIACCVPIRAHLAVVAAVAGIYLAVKQRSAKPFATFALPSLVGLELLSQYNHWIFGTWSISGGYMPYATDNLESIGHGSSIMSFFTDVLGSFVSLDRGIIIWCPLAIVLLVGLRAGWRESPDWVHVAALGGLAYYAIQMKISYFTGGDRFWSYRVILESLTLMTPLLAFAARDVLRRRQVVARLAAAAAVYCVGTQAVGAIFYVPDIYHYSPWWHSKLADELVSGGAGPRVIMALTVAGMVAAFRWPRPAPGPADGDCAAQPAAASDRESSATPPALALT
jgi:alpha-1,2-mannosyltransferase